MGWFFSVLPVSVDDSGADSFVICSSVVCRGSSCAGWRCSGLKFFWLWSFLTMQGKLFRLHFVCNNCCRRKSYMKVHFYPKAFFSNWKMGTFIISRTCIVPCFKVQIQIDRYSVVAVSCLFLFFQKSNSSCTIISETKNQPSALCLYKRKPHNRNT